jgi:ATP-binding cassette, subfamily B, bacterial CvaB/MchF/RaxB
MSIEGINLRLRKHIPVVLQTEAAECGLASLVMVASYHGYVTDLATMRSRHAISLKGATLAELMKIAAALKFQARPLRLDLEELRELKTPCILHWDLNHFVVLGKVSTKWIEIIDPANGKRKLSLTEVSKHFTGVAMELTPDIEFKEKKEKRRLRVRTLFGKVTGLKRSLLQIFILAAALEVFGIVSPFFSQWLIDDALVSGDKDLMAVLATGVLLVAIIRLTVGLIRNWVVMHMSTTLSLEWFANVFSHLLKLPIPWFERRHLGDIVSRFGSLGSIQQAMTGELIGVVLDGIMAIATLSLMFVYSPTLSAIVLTSMLVYAIVRIVRYGALRDASSEQLVRAAKQQSHFMESIRGIQALKLFNREEDRRRRYLRLAVETTNNSLSIQKQNMAFGAANGLLVALENAAVLFFGAKSVLAGHFSVGMLVAFLSYKDQFVTRISSLIDTGISFRMLGIQTERLADIVLTPPEEAERTVERISHNIEPTIEVRNVSFRYASGEQWILRNVNMIIDAGESVAIAGPSGCGKTTLLKIMLGQLKPEEGDVLIGGIPLKQIGLYNYRDQIGVVMQDDQLFAGSIAENIAFFDPQVDQERIETAAQLAYIDNDIVKMPMGYNTLTGDMGTGLSGGQKQRVLLARALYKRPNILFLDEATSHLDTNAELLVNQAIKKLSMTRITIAHRPQTLEMTDRLIILPLVNSEGPEILIRNESASIAQGRSLSGGLYA